MKQLIACLAVLTAFSTTLKADDCCDAGCCSPGTSKFYLGPQVYYTKLSIQNTDSAIGGLYGLQNIDTHVDGVMYGANGGYEYKQIGGLYANIDLNYGQGNLEHSGALSRYVHEYDVNGVLGYTIGECLWSVTGYAGIGYLTQNHSITSYDVKYRYHIYHVPVGIKADYAFSMFCSSWTIGLNIAALPQIDSTVKISQLQGARWSLAKRTDWLVSLPIEFYSSCLPLSVKMDFFWKRLGIGGSKAVSPSGVALGLPPSRWNAYGASLDLAWEF